MIDTTAIGAELYEAVQTAQPVPLITERHPELTWEDARAIATATDQLRLDAGEQRIGYKLGWTSAAMRDALGIDRPNWGTLWRSQISAGELDLDRFIHPKLEPELVWQVPRDERAAGEWALGLEIVDPRFPSFTFDFLDNTSDNSSSAAIALGPFSSLADGVDIADVSVTIGDGEARRDGVGRSAMGSPSEAVGWLARELEAEGRALSPGDLVFTGGLTPPYDVRSGRTYTLTSGSLGRVRVTAVDTNAEQTG